MKTRAEVEELVQQWKRDPCWDLADSEGFEDYRSELEAIARQQEAIWREEEQKRLITKGAELNIYPEIVERYEIYENLAEEKIFKAKNRLKFYFHTAIPNLNSDSNTEIDDIVDYIVDAAIAKVSASTILSIHQIPTPKNFRITFKLLTADEELTENFVANSENFALCRFREKYSSTSYQILAIEEEVKS